MKVLADKSEVSDRSFYYLLDFNDVTRREYIWNNFKKERLSDLTIKEYYLLFCYATQMDSIELIKSF